MKSVKDILEALHKKGVQIGKTQVIMDIRLGRLGLKAYKVGNSYAIEEHVAKEYIAKRIATKKRGKCITIK